MLTALSRQKSYADVRQRKLMFNVDDKVFLKVATMKGIMSFSEKGELSPRYIGPFEILQRVGDVSYKLALPLPLTNAHSVFHVLMLNKYIQNSSHVLSCKSLKLSSDRSYEELLVQILEREEKQLRSRKIPLVKVLWKNHGVKEVTWERQNEIRNKYPTLFSE